MIHALTLLIIILFAAPLARFIPLSVLAAILLVVSYNMGEWREIPELLKQSRFEIATWLVTFLFTVFADLTVAVEAGMILAALVFIRKVTQTTTVSEVTARVHCAKGTCISCSTRKFHLTLASSGSMAPSLFGATDKIDAIVSRLPDLLLS